MSQDRIIELLHAQPFAAFDMLTSDGRAYTVDHPDFFARSRDGRTVTFYAEDNRAVFIDLRHIVGLEIANRPAA